MFSIFRNLILIIGLPLLLISSILYAAEKIYSEHSKLKTVHIFENMTLFDETQNRNIPLDIYYNGVTRFKHESSFMKLPLINKIKQRFMPPIAIISQGKGINHTEYTFLANKLAEQGFFVISIQHDLPRFLKSPNKSTRLEQRKPIFEQGAANIRLVLDYLKKEQRLFDTSKIVLIGHAKGGDVSMYFASMHPEQVSHVISLDSLHMPFPRVATPRILSIRSNHSKPDKDILPTVREQLENGMRIITLQNAKPLDMSDRGSPTIKKRILEIILDFLR